MFELIREPDRIHVTMSSTLANVDDVDRAVREMLRSLGLNSEVFSISLALREALTNAVRHGNALDSGKTVWFECEAKDNVIRMVVRDEGPGFEWGPLLSVSPDPTQDHGRGIAIMQAYVSEFRYNAAGNRLELIKRIS